MDTILQVIAIPAVLTGTFFSVVGVLGFIRLPDVYTPLASYFSWLLQFYGRPLLGAEDWF